MKLSNILDCKRDEVESTIKQIIVGSSEYSLLMLFNEKQLRVVDGALTPYWITVRQSQIENDVRTKFGLGTADSLTTEEEAKLDHRRKNHLLNYETMPVKLEPDSQVDAIAKAAKYMMPFMAEAFEREEGEPMSDEYLYDEKEGCTQFKSKYTGNATAIDMFVHDAARVMADAVSSLPKELRFISEIFLKKFMRLVFDTRENRSIEELLEEAVNTAAATLFSSMRSTLGSEIFYCSEEEVEFFYKHDILNLLRNPQAPRVSADIFKLDELAVNRFRWHHNTFNEYTHFSTRSEYMRNAWNTFGRIEKYGPANFRVPGRLITMHIPSADIPSHFDSPDIIVDVLSQHRYDEVPLIPGYRLVSNPSYHKYGFVVDKEGDPYRECGVIVNAAVRKKLAQSYRAIGLDELADSVQSHTRMTVSQLVEHIRNNSEYLLPEEVSTYASTRDGLPKDSYRTLEITDFKDLVQNRRLSAQCEGFAVFTKKSLELAFGNGSAGCVSGHTIGSQGGRISAIKHAQTIFTHKGKQYILDATPPSNVDMSRPEPIEGSAYTKKRVGASAIKLSGSRHIHNSDAASVSKLAPETYEELLAKTDLLLTEKLKVFFHTDTDEELFKILVKLPRSDPIRRTFELVVRLGSGRADPSQLEELLKYVRDLSNADHATRRAIGLAQYNPPLLDDLESTLNHLWWKARNEAKRK